VPLAPRLKDGRVSALIVELGNKTIVS